MFKRITALSLALVISLCAMVPSAAARKKQKGEIELEQKNAALEEKNKKLQAEIERHGAAGGSFDAEGNIILYDSIDDVPAVDWSQIDTWTGDSLPAAEAAVKAGMNPNAIQNEQIRQEVMRRQANKSGDTRYTEEETFYLDVGVTEEFTLHSAEARFFRIRIDEAPQSLDPKIATGALTPGQGSLPNGAPSNLLRYSITGHQAGETRITCTYTIEYDELDDGVDNFKPTITYTHTIPVNVVPDPG